MRGLNIIGIIVSLGIFRYGSYVNNQLEEILWSSRGYFGYQEISAGMSNIGMSGAFYMILIGIFFIILYGVNIKHINRSTTKVISILGIIASVLFMLLNVGYLAGGNLNTFGIMYVLWWLFGLICLAFMIVLLVQAVQEFKGSIPNAGRKIADDVEDDFDVI